MTDHPAEAATRENDLEYRLGAAYQVIGCFLDHLGAFDTDAGQKLLDYFSEREGAPDPLPFDVKALSTHQQQWSSQSLVKQLRKAAMGSIHERSTVLLLQAADALSHPPQTDTVTEEMVEAFRSALPPYVRRPKAEHVRAALTAALAARGKWCPKPS